MKQQVLIAALITMVSAGALVVAQQNSVVPQPRAEALPAPAAATPNFGRTVPKPEGVAPTVPAGFTVTSYAELQAPRMMVYAPNGDLFVSSPAANTIVVLRDADNDGNFEACTVYAAGDPPGAGRGRGGAAVPPAVPRGCAGPLTNPNTPPAPAAARGGAAPAAGVPQRQGGAPGGARGRGQAPAAGGPAPGGGQRAGAPDQAG